MNKNDSSINETPDMGRISVSILFLGTVFSDLNTTTKNYPNVKIQDIWASLWTTNRIVQST